jgi:hypothetical protein
LWWNDAVVRETGVNQGLSPYARRHFLLTRSSQTARRWHRLRLRVARECSAWMPQPRAMHSCKPTRHLGRVLETCHTTYPQNDLQRDTRGYQTSGGPQCLHGWQNGWPVGPDNAASPC